MNITRIDLWTALLALLFSSAVLTGCNTERFNDPGCASDMECRGERICDGHRCIHPDGLTPESVPDGEEDVIEVHELLGEWSMEAHGTTERDGETETFDDEALRVVIREGDESDIDVFIGGEDAEATCGLGANLTSDGFEFLTDGCEMDTDAGQRGSYNDVSGSGQLADDGTLHFDLQATITAEGPDTPQQIAELNAVLEGTRIDGMP